MDSHFHIWNFKECPIYEKFEKVHKILNAVMGEEKCIDYSIEDFEETVKSSNINGAVFVQVANECPEEAEWLCKMAKNHPIIRGVVAGLSITKGSQVISEEIKNLKQYPQFVGMRFVPYDEGDIKEIFEQFDSIGILEKENLTLELACLHISPIEKLLDIPRKFPNLRVIINHCGHPAPVCKGDKENWTNLMKKFAQFPNVFMKISGLVGEAEANNWNAQTFLPFIKDLLTLFGSDRCMYGSNWPVCLMKADKYSQVYDVYYQCIKEVLQSDTEVEKVMKTNCIKIYQIPDL